MPTSSISDFRTDPDVRDSMEEQYRSMRDQALKRAYEMKERAIIDGIRQLWEAGELYMIDVPKHMAEDRLVIVEQVGMHAPSGIHERGWLVWTPWGEGWREETANIQGEPYGSVTGWVIYDGTRPPERVK